MASPAVRTLESLLLNRKLGATLTSACDVTRLTPSGVPDLDRVLGGGWRTGAISEVVGRRSTGRTRVLMATLAMATRQGQVVALVDAVDRFDPASAASAGVDLDRLLWVRGPAITMEHGRPPMIDRAIKQAVRACDLIIRAGGFAIVALDLADVPPRRVQALPSGTWLRLAHANEGRETTCLLLGESSMGRSARGVSVQLDARTIWTGDSAQARRFGGFDPEFTPRLSGTLAPASPAGTLAQAATRDRGW